MLYIRATPREAGMVIVGGAFEVDPSEREQFLASRHDLIRRSRDEPGCLEYTFSADPIDAGRVVLFEIWAGQEALDAHLVALRAGPALPGADTAPISSSITIYDVSGARQLGG
jgi:quinol monooxygenase YgiN